uniref:MFS transporter n=1 Tax=Thermofilum pendens TaxID=2269 RepID=A0A7J3X760_THEPE
MKLSQLVEGARGLPRNIKVLALGWLAWSPVQSMSRPYLQLYLGSLGANPEQISAVQSVQNVVNAASRVVGGYLADKKGRKRIIWLGTVLVSASYALMALAPSWTVYAAASVLSSAVLFYQPALESIQADSVAMHLRGRVYAALHLLSGSLSSVAPLGGAALVNCLGMENGVRVSLALSAAVGLGVALARYKWLEETLREPGSSGSLVSAYREVFSRLSGPIRDMVALDAALNFLGGLTLLWNYYVFHFLGVDATGLAAISSVSSVVGLLSTIPSGYLVDLRGRGLSLQLSIHLGTASLLLFVAAPPRTAYTLPLLLLCGIVEAVGGSLYSLAHSALRADVFPLESRGRVYALLGLPPAVAWSAGAAVGGWLYAALEPRAPFLASLVLRLALTPLLVSLSRRLARDVDAAINGRLAFKDLAQR